MSSSSSKTSTTSSQLTKVQNLNLQDTGGFTVADTKNSNISLVNVSSDAGAVSAGAALGKAAINSDNEISHAAIDLGSQAVSAGKYVAMAGLDNAQAAYQSGLSFGNNALDLVHAIVSESQVNQASLTASALSGYQSIAQQNSASDATQVQKIALYAVAAAVLLVVLPVMFKGN